LRNWCYTKRWRGRVGNQQVPPYRRFKAQLPLPVSPTYHSHHPFFFLFTLKAETINCHPLSPSATRKYLPWQTFPRSNLRHRPMSRYALSLSSIAVGITSLLIALLNVMPSVHAKRLETCAAPYPVQRAHPRNLPSRSLLEARPSRPSPLWQSVGSSGILFLHYFMYVGL